VKIVKAAKHSSKAAAASSSRASHLAHPADAVWVFGWTHFGTTGETEARMHKLTREIEIKDDGKWIRCFPGTEVFFTAR
jgi:hypothetical protein